MNGIMIIPTGLGCTLGGDAGFNPGVKLIAKCCDNLIINPNAVNASDINEMPENCWYTEGSLIDRFLAGNIQLKRPKFFNEILIVANKPATPNSFNAMNAGIWGLGAKVRMVELNTPLRMRAFMNPDGTAGGEVTGWEELVDQILLEDFDALALHTPIECDKALADYYWQYGGVNPWGRVEAMASKLITTAINKPTAHAPDEMDDSDLCGTIIAKQSQSCEIISTTYMFCVLKGLHRAPIVVYEGGLSNEDIDFLLTPVGCWGDPHELAREHGIPIIGVLENTTIWKDFKYPSDSEIIFVQNYLEAAGLLMSWRAGVNPQTTVLKEIYHG